MSIALMAEFTVNAEFDISGAWELFGIFGFAIVNSSKREFGGVVFLK